jgi:hypothetical protein
VNHLGAYDEEGRLSGRPFGCLKRIPTLDVLFRVPTLWRHDEAGSVRNVRPRHAHANRPTSRLGAPALYRLPAHFRMSIEQKNVDNRLVAINVAETVLDGGN